jgi:ArsR family transcriptional regulator, nickel/cobalt-responsive transcriptional repressor
MERNRKFSVAYCSGRLKALADPTRWAVLAQLLEGPRNVGELNDVLNIDPTLLSHHLRILRNEGFIVSIRKGKHLNYRLSPDVELTPNGRGINLGCCRLEMN